MPFAQTLLKRIVQLWSGQAGFTFFQIVTHDGFVDLNDLVDDALMRL